MSTIIVVDRTTNLEAFSLTSRLCDADTLALGCEGVDMGMPGLGGRLTVVEIGTPDACFLFDILDLQLAIPAPSAFELLRRVLESSVIVKIAHDCKWHSEALFKQLGIMLRNVHDTSAWHSVLTSGDGLHLASLNDSLVANGCEPIQPLDPVYSQDPAFWAKRPITVDMKAYALQHVEALFALQAAQLGVVTPPLEARCHEESSANVTRFREGFFQIVQIHPSQMGRLIGRGGSNIRALEERTGAIVATRSGPPPIALVHAPSQESLASAVTSLWDFTKPSFPSPFPHEPEDTGYNYEYGFASYPLSEDFAEDYYYRYSGEA